MSTPEVQLTFGSYSPATSNSPAAEPIQRITQPVAIEKVLRQKSQLRGSPANLRVAQDHFVDAVVIQVACGVIW